MPTPVEVYVVVAQKNREACVKLVEHLAPYTKRNALRVSHRHMLHPGDNAEAKLNEFFAQAQIIVLLRSVQFENDERCTREEACAYQAYGSKSVIPVIVSPHNWDNTRAFPTGLIALPRSSSSIETAPNQDAAWTEVAREIHEAAKRVHASRNHGYAAPVPSPVQYQSHGVQYQGHGGHAPVAPVMQQPVVTAPPTTNSPTSSKSSSSTTLRRFVGLCLFGFGVYYYASNNSTRPATNTNPALSPITALMNQCPSPCCGGSDCALGADEMRKVCPDPMTPCCASGRQCVPMACGEKLSASSPYNLRLAHATVNGREPSMNAQVCFRRIGSTVARQCVPYSSAHANSKNARATPPQPVPILLGDVLTGKGIEVEIWEQGQFTPAAQFITSHDNIKATALCMGLRLAPSSTSDTKVLVFLDDP